VWTLIGVDGDLPSASLPQDGETLAAKSAVFISTVRYMKAVPAYSGSPLQEHQQYIIANEPP